MIKEVLFEIGVEELPARFINHARRELEEKTAQWLKDERITFKSLNAYSTPRRLAIKIYDVAKTQTTITKEVRGPALKIAKDEEGNWTKAARGFTKGQNADVADIYIETIDGTDYIFVKKTIVGVDTLSKLPEFVQLIKSINFPQTMRWGSRTERFARPIRWLVALADNKVIPFEFAGVETNRQTRGHRFLGEHIELENAHSYETLLLENYCMVNQDERKDKIKRQIEALNSEDKRVIIDEELLDEVCNLVEYPTAFMGEFEAHFLELPSEVLITSMKEHQRYFPVTNKAGELLPYFVSVRNGDQRSLDNVIAGNEKVLRARLSDGEFFYAEDRNKSIDFFLNKMKAVVYQEKIGTLSEKVANVAAITNEIAQGLNLNDTETQTAVRAAELCKFDLMSEMVNEFPELQGSMGEKYALYYGESEEVARAIKEHYMPTQSNGDLPTQKVSEIVSVADKLDTIVSSISVGLRPTGSTDPYSLRRQALGVLRIMKESKWQVTIEELLEIVEAKYRVETNEVKTSIHDFFKQRMLYLLEARGINRDIAHAVLDEKIGNINYATDKAHVLTNKQSDEGFKKSQEALVRVLNLNTEEAADKVNPLLFETDSEKELYKEVEAVTVQYEEEKKQQKAEAAFEHLIKLEGAITNFFEHNMVMHDSEDIKGNRLALIKLLANLLNDFADLSKVEWNQHA